MAKLPDLSKFGIAELKSIIRNAETHIKKKVSEDLKKARKAAEQAAKEHGFSLEEVTGLGSSKKIKTKPKSPAKYKNPEKPDQTWSGRGRQPAWFKAAMESGKKPEELKV